jgi:tyrosyl-tRNA synthetase
LLPLLEGTDGVLKMSKSYPEHCVNLTDDPDTLFGKLMSIPDPMLLRYQSLLLGTSPAVLQQQQQGFADSSLNPRDVKAAMARQLVERYCGPGLGEQAEQAFVDRFRHNAIPEVMPEVCLPVDAPISLLTLMTEHNLAPSKAEARRLVQGGGVRLAGEKLVLGSEADLFITLKANTPQVLQVGKRKFIRLLTP